MGVFHSVGLLSVGQVAEIRCAVRETGAEKRSERRNTDPMSQLLINLLGAAGACTQLLVWFKNGRDEREARTIIGSS